MIQKTIRRLVFAVAALAVVAGCKGKQTQSNVESTPLAPGMDSSAVSSEPMKFSAEGSDSGTIAGLSSINFDYDKSGLNNDARKKIQGNADWMKKNPSVKVQIEGHCDARGSIEYNIALGERRANAVKNYMTSLGVSADRLSTISYGKEKPLVQGDTDSAYAKNRRANFVPLQ